MKKQIAIFTVLTTLVSSIFAMDTGAVFKNSFATTTPNFKEIIITDYASTYLWLSTPINQNLDFSTELMYKFGYNTYNGQFTNILDLDLLQFSGKAKDLSYNIGRFSFVDATGAIFSQTIDAVQLKYNFSKGQINFLSGYTGLLNSKNIFMQDSKAQNYFSDDGIYALANPLLVLELSTSLNFNANNLKLETITFFDFGSEKTNRYFFNLGFAGFIGSKVSYNFATGLGTVDFSSLMNFTKLNFDIYPTNKMILGFGTEYASGEQGPLKQFAGVTTRAIGSDVVSLFTTSELSANVKLDYLLNSMVLSGNVKAIFACPDSFKFAGVDSNVSLIYQVFTDLQVSAKAYGFFDVQNGGDDSKYGVTVDVTLAF